MRALRCKEKTGRVSLERRKEHDRAASEAALRRTLNRWSCRLPGKMQPRRSRAKRGVPEELAGSAEGDCALEHPRCVCEPHLLSPSEDLRRGGGGPWEFFLG